MHKRKHREGDTAYDERARRMAKGGSLPSGNKFPPSLHLAKKVLGAREWGDCMVHVCANPSCVGWVYPKLKPKEYRSHSQDFCPCCGQLRFRTVKRGAREVLRPKWWYIDFGLEQV
jgi:hypothetical protein